MLSRENNRIVTETGRGTPMGRLMREYWVPVLRSSQLVAGAAPQRIKVFGDNYVAFRSPNGEVGVMNEACPHRNASLMLARNEDCGLRCIYHGWKIAPSGEVLEAPTHPAEIKPHAIRTGAHPVRESQGIVWTWLGRGMAPVFPKLSFTDLPDDHVIAGTAILNCNWLRPLETLWDVFHAQILHNQTNRTLPRAKAYFSEGGGSAGELKFDYPEMKVSRTEYGFSYINLDAIKETHFHFIMPFIQHHTISPVTTDDKALQISVPIDDSHTFLWIVFYNRFAPLKPDGYGMRLLGSIPNLNNYMEGMDVRTPENRWGQNREAMARGESYAGVVGMGGSTIISEDVMVIESQGDIDRSQETLSPVDRALVEGRKTLLDAVAAYERGEAPLGRDLDLTNIEALFIAKHATE